MTGDSLDVPCSRQPQPDSSVAARTARPRDSRPSRDAEATERGTGGTRWIIGPQCSRAAGVWSTFRVNDPAGFNPVQRNAGVHGRTPAAAGGEREAKVAPFADSHEGRGRMPDPEFQTCEVLG